MIVRLAESFFYGGVRDHLRKAGLIDVPKRVLEAPEVKVVPGGSGIIRAHINGVLSKEGWASPVPLEEGLGPELNAIHPSGVAFQTQTGNVARAFYDLMKIQSLHDQRRISCAILALPSSTAARVIGGNLASFDRVKNELTTFFSSQIACPTVIASFE